MSADELPHSVSLLHLHHLSRQHAELLRQIKSVQANQEKLNAMVLRDCAGRSDVQLLRIEHTELQAKMDVLQSAHGVVVQRVEGVEELVRSTRDDVGLLQVVVDKLLSSGKTSGPDLDMNDMVQQLRQRIDGLEKGLEEVKTLKMTCHQSPQVPGSANRDDSQLQIPIPPETAQIDEATHTSLLSAPLPALPVSDIVLQTSENEPRRPPTVASTAKQTPKQKQIRKPTQTSRAKQAKTTKEEHDLLQDEDLTQLPIKSVRLRSGRTFSHVTVPTRSTRIKREVKLDDQDEAAQPPKKIVVLKVKWPQKSAIFMSSTRIDRLAGRSSAKIESVAVSKIEPRLSEPESEEEL